MIQKLYRLLQIILVMMVLAAVTQKGKVVLKKHRESCKEISRSGFRPFVGFISTIENNLVHPL